MESFIQFFTDLSTGQKAIWLGFCLTAAWVLEGFLPFYPKKNKQLKHNLVNMVFLCFTLILNTIFGLIILKFIYPFVDANKIGFLYLFDAPLWVELLLALLTFDLLAQYLAHVLLHKVSFMWRFHMIHHSDTIVVATTGTRHHPIDYAIREIFSLIAIFISGAPFGFYMVYRMVTVIQTYATHGNFLAPCWLDKLLCYVIVSPNMHKFHHHNKSNWTDSNYGNIFSIWDRLFKTLVYDDPKKIVYGLDILENTDDEDIGFQLGIPFNKKIPSTLDK